jgi:hypothetical protein
MCQVYSDYPPAVAARESEERGVGWRGERTLNRATYVWPHDPERHEANVVASTLHGQLGSSGRRPNRA